MQIINYYYHHDNSNNKLSCSENTYQNYFCDNYLVYCSNSKTKTEHIFLASHTKALFLLTVLFMVFFNQNSVGVFPPPSCSNFIYYYVREWYIKIFFQKNTYMYARALASSLDKDNGQKVAFLNGDAFFLTLLCLDLCLIQVRLPDCRV